MARYAFPLTGPINLSVRLGHGSVLVRTQDNLTEAVVELDAPDDVLDRVTVEMQGRTLTLHAPRTGGLMDVLSSWRGFDNKDEIHAVITVPTRTAAKIATFTAPVTVEGTLGGADLASGTADVQIETIDGDLRLRYGTADVMVESVTGAVHVRSGAGNARFHTIDGALNAGSGNGRIEADRVGGAVHIRTGSGEAHLGAVYGNVDLASGSGRISLGLPAGIAARLDVMTGSGRVESDLPIENARNSGGRAITIRARTGSGDVRLFRAASTAASTA